jgi:hypothetical protein
MGHSKAVLRGKFLSMVHILKGQKDLNKQPNATSQTPRKTRTSKTQIKQKGKHNKVKG